MDRTTVSGMMGVSGQKETTKKKDEKGDADSFSTALDEAVNDKGDKKPEKKEEVAKADKKKAENKEAEARESDKKEVKGKQDKATKKVQNLLHNIAFKDASTLSVFERHNFQVGEFAKDKVGLTDLQRLLANKGIQVKDLSFQQLQRLAEQSSPKELQRLLDSFLAETKGDKGAVSKEQTAASGSMNHGLLEHMMAEETINVKEAQKADTSTAQQERQKVLDQILAQVKVRNLANQTEMSLRLNPEYLGEVRIQLTHDEGGVRARFETTSQKTKAILAEAEEEMVAGINDRGIRMNKMEVRLVDSINVV